jgi:hypothetical protein
LVDDCPDSYQNFEVEWDDDTLILPSITEVIHHIRVSEINLAEKTRCVQSCISHLPNNPLLDSVDSFAFIRYAKQCKDVCHNLYRRAKFVGLTSTIRATVKGEIKTLDMTISMIKCTIKKYNENAGKDIETR